MGAAPGPIPAPFHTPLDPQGALASANGHRGVPRADAGAGTPGRGRRRKRDARTTGDARDEPRRDRGAGPANPRGRVRRDDAPGGGKGETTPRGGDGSRKGDHRGRSGGHRGRFPLEPGHTASNLRDTPPHTHDAPSPETGPHLPTVRCLSLVHTHRRAAAATRAAGAPRTPSETRPTPPITHGCHQGTDRPVEAHGRRATGGSGASGRSRGNGGGADIGRGAHGRRRRRPPTTANSKQPNTRLNLGRRRAQEGRALRDNPQPRDPPHQRRTAGGGEAIDRQATLRQA